MSMLELFQQGGFIMYPLTIFSILTWTVALEKMYFLRKFLSNSKKIHEDLTANLLANRMEDVKWILKSAPILIAAPHEALFDEKIKDKEILNNKVARKLGETATGLKSNMWILGTISSSAPFIGLFGTVTGIMSSFKAIGDSGKAGFAVVAGGISESLIATAAGIMVAVVAVIFYNYFQTKINASVVVFRNNVEELADIVASKKNERG